MAGFDDIGLVRNYINTKKNYPVKSIKASIYLEISVGDVIFKVQAEPLGAVTDWDVMSKNSGLHLSMNEIEKEGEITNFLQMIFNDLGL